MDLINTIRESIRFIEDNLDNDVKQQDVAKYLHLSLYHFHRMFKILTNITPNEYIRNRKLSKAAEDLTTTSRTVLEVSLDYGYESQGGFEKAFYRFHGVNPGKVKQNNVELKAYHPLTITLDIKGGKSMDYKIIQLEEFELATISKRFNFELTSKDDNHDIPMFWEKNSNNGEILKLMDVADEKVLFGYCAMVEDSSEEFEYGIAVKSAKSNDYEKVIIPSGFYAVFKVEKLENFGEVWNSINKEFLVNSKYDRRLTPDLEYYPHEEGTFAEIWLPVIEKS